MGNTLLIAAFICSLVSIVAFFTGGITRRQPVMSLGKVGIFAAAGLVTAATVYMITLLVSHNFAFEYAAEYTSTDLSGIYLLGALWAGNQGAMLFWTWLLAIIGVLLVVAGRPRDREIMPYALAVVMINEAFLLSISLFGKNPFEMMGAAPIEGLGLTPFFEHAGMLLHPPILMAGYAGLTVPFALAIGALIAGKMDNDWLISARRWALISWLLLGAGIILGAWWNYNSLGDGNFWHWDPVENASLLPWLTATAFLHSIAMQRKRGVLKVWSLSLIIITFGFVIFSTYLSRSDVIADATTSTQLMVTKIPGMGPSILVFMAATMLLSFLLVFLRRGGLESRRQVESIISKEGTFLLTNLLFLAAAAAILAGTVYVLLRGGSLLMEQSLIAPFFNHVSSPIFLAVILLAGICIATGWRRMNPGDLGRSLMVPFVASIVIAAALFIFGIRQWYAIVGLASCIFVPFTAVAEWWKSTQARSRGRKENYFKAFVGLIWSDRPRHGGYIIHIAIILISVGLIGASAFGQTEQITLKPGQYMEVGKYSLAYRQLSYEPVPGKMIFSADMAVEKNNKPVAEVTPVKYFDQSFNGEVNTAAVLTNPVEDLYVTIVGWDVAGNTEFKASVRPLVMWIWIGAWLMVAGGVIAFWPGKEKSENIQVEEGDTGSV
jgi:cytochrome c-type biogenesis protein CcmF